MKNKYFNTLLLAVIFTSIVSTVSASPKIGDKYFYAFDWSNAAIAYEKYEKNNPGDLEVVEKIATCYRMMNDWQSAEEWYGKLYDSGTTDEEVMYLYGQSLRANQNYDLANIVFENYGQLSGSTHAKGLVVNDSELSDLLTANNFVIENLHFNTPQADFAPSVHDDELFFTSDRFNKQPDVVGQDNWNSRNFLEVYKINTSNLTADGVEELGKKSINGQYHEGVVSFHPVSDEMFFTRTNYTGKKITKSDDEVAKLKIFKSYYVDGTMVDQPEEAFPFNNDEYSVGHVTFNEDGTVIYFSSDMPGGYGGSDIWMSQLVGSQFSTPVNLGEDINTEGSEMFPYLFNNKLYFSSNGHYGLGGLDLYSASVRDDGFSSPKNLGFPLNSNADDFAIAFSDDKVGYFSSNRVGGKGDDDIYSFVKLAEKIKVLAYDATTLEPLANVSISMPSGEYTTDANGAFSLDWTGKNEVLSASLTDYNPMTTEYYSKDDEFYAKVPLTKIEDKIILNVRVVDKDTQLPLSNAKVNINGVDNYTDANGYTKWEVFADKNYVIAAEKTINTDKKYLPVSTDFNTNGVVAPHEMNAQVELVYFELGKEIVIKDIYYDLDKFFIRPDAAGELHNVISLLNEYPSMEVELGSHTDCRASMAYNQTLSQNRAQAAVDFLAKEGIDKNRMTYKGYGETQLVNDCACECEQSIQSIGLRAFRDCEDAQVADCSDDQHQNNRRTTFKITKF